MIEEMRSIERPALQEALGWIGRRVEDICGVTVGTLEDVWLDPATNEPRWLLIRGGRFGGHHTVIPFADAIAGAGHIWVPYERQTVRRAPNVSPQGGLDRELELRLESHYTAARGRPATPSTSPSPRPPERAHRLGP